jgi:hypothetical protein
VQHRGIIRIYIPSTTKFFYTDASSSRDIRCRVQVFGDTVVVNTTLLPSSSTLACEQYWHTASGLRLPFVIERRRSDEHSHLQGVADVLRAETMYRLNMHCDCEVAVDLSSRPTASSQRPAGVCGNAQQSRRIYRRWLDLRRCLLHVGVVQQGTMLLSDPHAIPWCMPGTPNLI